LNNNKNYYAQPLYYGMLLFHIVAQGRIVPVNFNTSVNITAYSVTGDDGKLRLALFNKESKLTAKVQIETGKLYSQAGIMRLRAPSLQATQGITLAGRSVGSDGTWVPAESEVINPNAAGYEIDLPAASAAVITFQ
jgi:hypothetical protein